MPGDQEVEKERRVASAEAMAPARGGQPWTVARKASIEDWTPWEQISSLPHDEQFQGAARIDRAMRLLLPGWTRMSATRLFRVFCSRS
jgi:hypothetical protein